MSKASCLRFAALASVVSLTAGLGACSSVVTNPAMQQASLSERDCMTRVMYFESNRSSEEGMKAVGTVVMNRMQSQQFPSTVCGVVGQKNQFAQGALTKPMNTAQAERISRVADAVLSGERNARVGRAMYFHTAGLRFPYKNMHYTVVAGGNAFYEKRGRGVPTFTPVIQVADATPVPSQMQAYTPIATPVQPVQVAAITPKLNLPAPMSAPVVSAPVMAMTPLPPPRPAPVQVASLSVPAYAAAQPPLNISDLIAMDLRR